MGADQKSRLFAVLRAAASLESQVEARLATIGLSLPKLAALHHLVSSGDSLPLGQLAERLSCVKSNVTQLVDRLESDGLVSREPDPNDRRSRLAVITSSGRRLYEQGVRIRQDAEQELFGVLTLDESRQLGELIAKLDRVHV